MGVCPEFQDIPISSGWLYAGNPLIEAIPPSNLLLKKQVTETHRKGERKIWKT
jgi:hypothetical protein